MDRIVKYIIMFIVLVLLQALLFSNFDYFGFICPYIYILFILALPIGFNIYWSMLLAFFIGLLIDIFSNTPGVHMSSTVLIAAIRNPWLSRVISNDEIGYVEPSLQKLGLANFLRYSVLLILIHHIVLFFAEACSFDYAWFTFLKAIVNSVVTSIIILCYYAISKS